MNTKYFLNIALCAIIAGSGLSVPAFAAGGSGDSNAGTFAYMELDPLLLPIVTEEGITQQVSLIVKIELADPSKIGAVEALEPKIVDAFVQDLYGTLSKKNAMVVHGILNIPLIKARLKHTAIDVAGEENITDVLLQVVQQHRV